MAGSVFHPALFNFTNHLIAVDAFPVTVCGQRLAGREGDAISDDLMTVEQWIGTLDGTGEPICWTCESEAKSAARLRDAAKGEA